MPLCILRKTPAGLRRYYMCTQILCIMTQIRCLCLGYKGIQGIQASCIGEVLEVMVFVELCYIQVAIQGMLMSSHAKKKEIKEIKDGERKVQADACSVKNNTRQRRYHRTEGGIFGRKERPPSTPSIYCTEMKGE